MFNYNFSSFHIMTTQTALLQEKKLWVIVNTLKENVSDAELEHVSSSMKELIDDWHSQQRFVWSGSLDDNKTGMAIFEGTDEEAKEFFEKNKKACSGVLDSSLQQWNAMPFLSLL